MLQWRGAPLPYPLLFPSCRIIPFFDDNPCVRARAACGVAGRSLPPAASCGGARGPPRRAGRAGWGVPAGGRPPRPPSAEPYPSRDKTPAPAFAPVRVPLDQIAPELRERVRAVVDQPTLATRGPVEAFACNPAVYAWLLDHPDQAVRLWRRLRPNCPAIHDKGKGRFTCSDG